MTTPQGGSSSLADQLVTLIADELTLVDEPIDENTELLLTGAVDSLGVAEIVAYLEDVLGIEIDPADVILENFRTVSLMVEYVRAVHGAA